MPREGQTMSKHQLKADEERLMKSCEKSQLKMNDGDPGSGGYVTGYASTFDREPDCYGDVVAPGAFADTLERWKALNEQGKYIPLLYGHNAMDPEYNIGRVVKAEEDERGLLVTAEFDADNEKAQYVRKLVREGRVYQFSFAFDVMEAGETTLENGVKANELRKLDLFEVSLVQIPANQHATVEEIKGHDGASTKANPNADGEKAGRRNSKTDEDQMRKALGLLSEVTEILNGLLADSDSDGTGGTDEGDSAGKADEGRESKAEMLALYKQAVIDTYKGE